ncbi:MAG: hypothetical protein QF570_07420 [Myxococcota bacterium]|jgi:hypothetical protein|nr:hypothetical protein [Myxococcota bacterium]
MEVSSRYALAAAFIAIVCAIPVWFHASEAPTRDECRDPDAFFLAKRVGGAQMRDIRRRFEAGDAKGELRTSTRNRVRVHAFRTHETFKLYGSPMSFGFDSMSYLVPRETRQIEAGDDLLPVHWSTYEMDGRVHLEAWVFAQGGKPVRHPLAAWVPLAWKQLFDGTQPLTVMIASAVGRPGEMAQLGEATEGWFASSWEQLRAACDS